MSEIETVSLKINWYVGNPFDKSGRGATGLEFQERPGRQIVY
jgi:hypothetical protein